MVNRYYVKKIENNRVLFYSHFGTFIFFNYVTNQIEKSFIHREIGIGGLYQLNNTTHILFSHHTKNSELYCGPEMFHVINICDKLRKGCKAECFLSPMPETKDVIIQNMHIIQQKKYIITMHYNVILLWKN